MKMYIVVAISLIVTIVVSASVERRSIDNEITQLPESCSSPVYCHGNLLKTVQLAHLYKDSKTFVDMKMKQSEAETLKNFDNFMNATCDKPTPAEVRKFVEANFEEGDELTPDKLSDWKSNPSFVRKIKDSKLRDFALGLNNIWPTLAVRIKKEVLKNSGLYSIEPVPNVFVKPGGRFTEPYYWDSYWIVSGLLICDMPVTTRGVIENMLWFVDKYGFIPNGGRIYYAQRSQPPLLTGMVQKYIEYTKDLDWLSQNIQKLDSELTFWLCERTVEVGKHTLLRFYARSAGPRPESYREDYITADQKQETYTELKSGAESGWDFSSRWFISEEAQPDLKDIKTSHIIPVDLNAIFCGAAADLADLYLLLDNQEKAQEWREVHEKYRNAIFDIMWDEEEGSWFDVNLNTLEHRKKFYPSNVAPLWTKCLGKQQNADDVGTKMANYLIKSGAIDYPGGIPTSLDNSGEQWDFPNAWPPLQDIIIAGLENSGSDLANKLAFNLTERWVMSNYRGFRETEMMFEKYDVETSGKSGGGGEYEPQSGFGWTNGVILEFLNKHGDKLTTEQ